MEWLTEFTNSPIFITLSSIFSVLGSILIIIGKTSFGKKAIAKLTDMTNQTKADVENIKVECKSALDEVKTALNTLEAEKETYKKELDTQVRVYFNQFSFYETQMFDTLSQIPNAKVQSNFTFTMASSGDPSTFTFTLDAFPDYTKWNKTEKVFSSIQVITYDAEAEEIRKATDADYKAPNSEED